MNYKKLSGDRLAAAHEKLNERMGRRVSRRELCEMVAVEGGVLESSALGNYESGYRYPNDPKVFIYLSKVLDEPAPYLAGLVTDERLIEILRAYDAYSDEGKEALLASSRALSPLTHADRHETGVSERIEIPTKKAKKAP